LDCGGFAAAFDFDDEFDVQPIAALKAAASRRSPRRLRRNRALAIALAATECNAAWVCLHSC
jgi:hypothetical protein